MARFQPEEGDRFTAISGTPGSERGQAYEELIRDRLETQHDPDLCTVKLPDSLNVDENAANRLEGLHRHVVKVSIESAGEETWQRVTRGQQRQMGHDLLRQGSCDLVVTQSIDIVQMLKQQARPLFGGQTWEAAPDHPALIEVTFCSALIWLKVYQLERFLTLILCRGEVAIEVVSAGVIINGQPLTCHWAEGLQNFPETGPVRTLVKMGRFHIVDMPMARVDEVDRIYEKLDTKTQELDTKTQELDTKTQELDTKTQELDTKTQELDTKTQELTSARSELVLRGWELSWTGVVKSFTDDSYVAYSETSAPASFVALSLVQCLVD
ncbi:unnamed protein product [Symbiodinium sp. CCMP2592]|nr:unnamed protein product [Symbiodinium sp. CCMP2592]